MNANIDITTKTVRAIKHHRVRPIVLQPIRLLMLLMIMMQYSTFVDANTLTRHLLKHRSPEDIQQTLLPLLPQGSAIVIDNHGVIVSAPASMKGNITALIQQMDKPHQQLVVTVFRGRHPEKKGHMTHSTRHGIQTQERIITQNGQAIAITNNNLVRIPISHRIGAGDILLEDNEAEGNSARSDTALPFRQQQSQLVDAPTGLYLRATVPANPQNDTWVNMTSTLVSAVHQEGGETDRQKKERIALTRSVESTYRIPINQWYQLSSQQQFSHPADLAAQGKPKTTVYSTAAHRHQQSVWIKVDVVE